MIDAENDEPEARGKLKRKEYEQELARLYVEFVKLQQWVVVHKGLKVCIFFEGRDGQGRPRQIFPRLLIWRAGGELFFASIERRRGAEDCTGRKPSTSEVRACGRGFGELHRHQRLRRAVALNQRIATPRYNLRVCQCARRNTRADAAVRHRGRHRVDQLLRTCDRRRARLATEGATSTSQRTGGCWAL